MPSDKLRAEWFWVDRWATSSARSLHVAARGLYREMLSLAWVQGGKLPSDHQRLQRLVGISPEDWATYWPQIAGYWDVSEDGQSISNATQLEVLAEAERRAGITEDRARKAAEARWSKNKPDAQAMLKQCSSIPQASAQAMLKQCPPSPSPSQSQIQITTTDSASAEVAAVAATRAPRRRKVSKPQEAAAAPAEAAPVHAEPPTPSPEPRGEPESTGGSPNASALVLAAPETVSAEAVAEVVGQGEVTASMRAGWFERWLAGRKAHDLGPMTQQDRTVLATHCGRQWKAWGADSAADSRMRAAIDAWFADTFGLKSGFKVGAFVANIDSCDLAGRGVHANLVAPPPAQVGGMAVPMTGRKRTDNSRRAAASVLGRFPLGPDGGEPLAGGAVGLIESDMKEARDVG